MADDGKRLPGDGRFVLNAKANFRGEVQERRWQSDFDPIRGWRMTGSALQAMDVIFMVREAVPEEEFEEEIHVVIRHYTTLADCSQIIYIYIYTQTQLFRISILERFWRGSGEVLERDLGDQKSQNTSVLQRFLIATIKNSLVFLGF